MKYFRTLYDGLSEREKKLGSIAFLLLAISVFYFWIFTPLIDFQSQAKNTYQKASEQHVWLQEQVKQVNGKSGVKQRFTTEDLQRINKQASINPYINRTEPKDSTVRLTLDRLPHQLLWPWLHQIVEQGGNIENLALERAVKGSTVRVVVSLALSS